MKLKMNQLSDFNNFYESNKDKHCALKTSYKLNKLYSAVLKELEFYREKFSAIVQEFAKRDENGNYVYTDDGSSVEIADGKNVECQEKVAELQNLEVELPDITFTIEEFNDMDISVAELNSLMPLITE